MPSLLSPQELVVLQQETNFTGVGIPPGGSWVVTWDRYGNGNYEWILIYNSTDPTVGFVVSDISDLSSSLINQLIANSTAASGNPNQPQEGWWYYLPQAVEDTISSDTEVVISAAKSAGQSVADLATSAANGLSNAASSALTGFMGALTPALIVVGLAALFLVYREFK